MSNPHAQFLSRVSGKPTKKHTIYFTCPITERFKYGRAFGKEVVAGPQDLRDKVRRVCGWAVKDKLIDAEEHNKLLEEGYEHIKNAEQEERNKKLLNPLWVAWNEENRPTKPKKTKTKGENENNCPRHLQLERKNADLTTQVEELQNKNEELQNKNAELEQELALLRQKEKQDRFNVRSLKRQYEDKLNEIKNQYEEHYKKLYNDLIKNNKITPKKKEKGCIIDEPEPEPKKTNKGKKYKTKNTIIDEVVEELVNEVVNDL
jgi:hypothetical protein